MSRTATKNTSMKMKNICICCVFCLVTTTVAVSQDTAKVLYSQKAKRDDKAFFHFLRSRKGFVILTTDSLIFRTKKASTGFYNFAFGYCELKSVRTWYGYLYPDRIRIRTKTGHCVRLFVYKRKKLLRLSHERMAVCGRQ